jgi:peptidoglycan/LPS O-acetylase OafA/YrhL
MLGRVLSLGFLSVGFFFLLSGYILSVVYLREGEPVAKRSFYAARFARVYPLFFVMLIAGAPFLLFARIAKYGMVAALVKTAVSFTGNIFMLQAWILELRGIDNPNWSLSVETVFYIIFPLLGMWIWRLKDRFQVVLTGFAVYVASQALLWMVCGHLSQDAAEMNPLLNLGTFTMGILLARWHTLYRRQHGPSPRSTLTSGLALVLAIAAFSGAVVWHPRPSQAVLGDGLLAPVFAALLWAFSNNRSVFSQWLSVKWLVVLGEASYGLYLIHFVTYQLFEALGGVRIPALYPVYLLGSIGLSVLSLYYVETPARKWLLKRLQTRPRETMEAASDAQ